MENLELIIKQSNLAETESKSILDRFADYEKVAEQWKEKAKTLEVTSSEQITEMAMAKEARKKFSQMRIDLDKARKELGEPAMRKWKAINAVANYLQSLINPIESYLKEQETFAEREILRLAREAKEKEDRRIEEERAKEEKIKQEKINKYNDRRVELAKYSMFDVPKITVDTTDEDYSKIVSDLKIKLDELNRKNEEEAEKQRIYNSRKIELAKYSMLTVPQIDINTTEEEYRSILAVLDTEKKAYDEGQLRIKQENEKLKLAQDEKDRELREAKEKQEKLEAEIKAKKDEEEKAKRDREEAEAKAKEEEAKKGDREKLKSYLNKIKQIEVPQVEDLRVKEVINQIQILVNFDFENEV